MSVVMTASTTNYLWSLQDVLGQGATASVYKARNKVRWIFSAAILKARFNVVLFWVQESHSQSCYRVWSTPTVFFKDSWRMWGKFETVVVCVGWLRMFFVLQSVFDQLNNKNGLHLPFWCVFVWHTDMNLTLRTWWDRGFLSVLLWFYTNIYIIGSK